MITVNLFLLNREKYLSRDIDLLKVIPTFDLVGTRSTPLVVERVTEFGINCETSPNT